MKMTKILSLVLAIVMLASCFVACGGGTSATQATDPTQKPADSKPTGSQPTGSQPTGSEPVDPGTNPLAGTYEVSMWVSEMEGVSDLFKSQIRAFEAAYPGITIVETIDGVTEADAGSRVVADLLSAPDMFCFAQDQLARLVQASALAAPSESIANLIKAENDKGSVGAGSVAGTLYAYPMTSDNGYYMYYDTSIITNPESLEQIIADCEASGKLFRYALENGWYTASFFFAVPEGESDRICVSDWTTDDKGNFTSTNDNFNSANGLVAMKGMMKLAQSSCYDSNADIFTDAAVVITGIWNANTAAEYFGANLGATDLPSFEVDGKSYHLGSFTGNKLIGVKPQTDSKKAAVLQLLAQFLTNEQCQLERYEQFQWGPSNIAAQNSDAVQANTSLAALAKQGNYGVAQGQIHGSWWDLAAVLGKDAKAATSVADLETSLKAYADAIDALFQMTEEQKMAWSVIGTVSGTSWDTDLPMTMIEEGVWESIPVEFTADTQFKLRRGAAWDVQVGADGQVKTPSVEPANIVPLVTGTYIVRLEWDGVSDHATVTWRLAE